MNDQAVLERVLARRCGEYDSVSVLKHVSPPTQEIRDWHVPEREVTQLPEHHDPAGEVLPFHVPSGRASQVLGSVAIDPARMPSDLDPTLTDSKRRTLRVEHQVARGRDVDAGVSEIGELVQASKFAKDAATWGARIHVTVRVSR